MGFKWGSGVRGFEGSKDVLKTGGNGGMMVVEGRKWACAGLAKGERFS